MKLGRKLALAMMGLAACTALSTAGLLYFGERSGLSERMLEEERLLVTTVVKVAEEAFSGDDDLQLIHYLRDLRDGRPELLHGRVIVDGYVLAHTDPSLIGKRADALPAPPDAARSHEGRALRGAKAPAVVELAFSKAAQAGRVQELLGRSRRRILWASGAAALIGALAGIVAAWFLTRPLGPLVEGAQRIQAGDFRVRLPEPSSDEIGVLSREFNEMARRLGEVDRVKKDFLSSVTHELRSPLLAMESYADLLLDDIQGETGRSGDGLREKLESWSDYLWTVKNNAVRLGGFINELLDASKIERGKMTLSKRMAALKPMLDDTERLFRARAEEAGVALKAACDDGLPLVYVDPDRLNQALRNLVSNALKFTPRGGTVSLEARLKGEEVEVSVSDTGKGIPSEAIGKLFEPFFQVPGTEAPAGPGRKRKAKGTGLGLHITKSLVEMHGGRIRAESPPGGGTRFAFTLPVQRRTAS